MKSVLFWPLALAVIFGLAEAQQPPAGEVKGTAWQHTPQSL